MQEIHEEEHTICRLCWRDTVPAVDIYDLNECSDGARDDFIEKTLSDLFGVKFGMISPLPNKICEMCFELVNCFKIFKKFVHENELAVLKRIADEVVEDIRPGLNGAPGVFVPLPHETIIEVDFDKPYVSSDEEVSVDSDAENNTEARRTKHAEKSKKNSKSRGKPNKNKISLQHEQAQAAESAVEQATPMLASESLLSVAQAALPPTAAKNAPAAKELMNNKNIDVEEYNANWSNAKEPIQIAVGKVSEDSLSMEYTSASVSPSRTYDEILAGQQAHMCQYCDRAYSEMERCAEHEKTHDPDCPFTCILCQLRTKTRPLLITHIRDTHDANRPFICSACLKPFGRRSDLKKHTIVHTGVRPFTCHICQKSFSRNTNLRKHLRIHSSLKPHVCKICPRSFSTKSDLVRHANSHLQVKPFQCNRCSSSFTRKDKLKAHEMVHKRRDAQNIAMQSKVDAIRNPSMNSNAGLSAPLKNEIVASQGSYIIQQTAPVQTAGGQLPQERLPILKLSLSKIPAARSYRCDICDQTFPRERDLQRHRALHLDMLYKCKECGAAFNRLEQLNKHTLEQHTNTSVAPPPAKMIKLEEPEPILTKMNTAAQPRMPNVHLGFYSETRPDKGNCN